MQKSKSIALVVAICVLALATAFLRPRSSAAPQDTPNYGSPKEKVRSDATKNTKAALASDEMFPRYNEDGALYRPNGFREWIFVGAAIGLSYSEHKAANDDQRFTNVYINPAAYEEYKKSGEFPDQTIFAMPVYTQSQKPAGLPRFQGAYEDKIVSLEVAVKDNTRFDNGWAYFDFSADDDPTETGAAFPQAKCFDCHADHASDDNVFVQFYPVLRRATELREASE